jgi:hypothetical protein
MVELVAILAAESKDSIMKKSRSTFRLVILALAAMTVALGVSCSQPAPVAPPPSEVGRFQLVVAPEGERGVALFLVDTKMGKTWFYRAPQGFLANGFWSDVPQLTYGDDYWRQMFAKMVQAQQPTPPPSADAGMTNAPSPSGTNR